MNNKLSTTFHPQTDKQIKGFNQTVEQYLRCYINYNQNNWVKHLPITQFIYNIFIYISTKQTPFFTIYRYYPEIYKTLIIGLNNLYVIIKVEYLKFLYNKFKNELSFIKDRIIKYYN